MRANRLPLLATVAALVSALTAGCATPVAGKGSLAAGVPTPSLSPTSGDAPSSTAAPTETASDTPSPTDTPTVNPTKTKEQLLCVLTQATVKTTNDRFNVAKTREQQLSILRSGASGVSGHLRRSGLTNKDRIFALAANVLLQLQKLINTANRGGSPSTAPYNAATTRFRTGCASL
jgi:hypothetical protein